MSQIISYGKESAAAMLKGIETVMRTVKGAYGPMGGCTVAAQYAGRPAMTRHGCEIVKEIELADPVEDTGAALFKKLADEVNEAAGDGTTASLIIAEKIIKLGHKNISAGASPVLICRGIRKALGWALEYMESISRSEGEGESVRMCASSAAGNRRTGELVAEAFEKVNYRGTVSVRYSPSEKSYVQSEAGMSFDRGYFSPFMATDMAAMEAVLEEPYILLCSRKIEKIEELLPLLNEVSLASATLLIIADDIAEPVMTSFLSNIYQRTIKICASRAPGFGLYKRNYLEDIAVLTGTQVYGEAYTPALDTVGMKDCGRAARAVVGRESTSIYGGGGSRETVERYVHRLERQLESGLNQLEKEKVNRRIANLTDGSAVICAGAATESERRFRKADIEAAVRAAENALKGGYVAGGAAAFTHAAAHVGRCAEALEAEERTGALILSEALLAPVKQLAANAGAVPEVIAQAVMEADSAVGFSADSARAENMLAKGIADPAFVVKTALEKAVSMAASCLYSGAVVSARVVKMREAKNTDALNIDASDFM